MLLVAYCAICVIAIFTGMIATDGTGSIYHGMSNNFGKRFKAGIAPSVVSILRITPHLMVLVVSNHTPAIIT